MLTRNKTVRTFLYKLILVLYKKKRQLALGIMSSGTHLKHENGHFLHFVNSLPFLAVLWGNLLTAYVHVNSMPGKSGYTRPSKSVSEW